MFKPSKTVCGQTRNPDKAASSPHVMLCQHTNHSDNHKQVANAEPKQGRTSASK